MKGRFRNRPPLPPAESAPCRRAGPWKLVLSAAALLAAGLTVAAWPRDEEGPTPSAPLPEIVVEEPTSIEEPEAPADDPSTDAFPDLDSQTLERRLE